MRQAPLVIPSSLPDPSRVLSDGSVILGTLLLPLGFEFCREEAGKGSGGFYAVGKFRRADRVLDLHFRYSLGLVSYHAASISLSHEDYMWSVLGKRFSRHYPGFSSDPLEGFRHLLRDLEEYGTDFLKGPDGDFSEARRAGALAQGIYAASPLKQVRMRVDGYEHDRRAD